MSYTPKKENIIKLNDWVYKTSVTGELQKFHKKNVYERYDKGEEEVKEGLYKELCSQRIVFWYAQRNIEADTIAKNPTKENAENRMRELRKIKDCTPIIFGAMVNYLKDDLEHIKNLGHTEAYSYLCNVLDESNKLVTPTPFETFEFKGDISNFYKQCIEYEVIDNETSLDSFKMAFDGGDLRGFDDFVFKFKQDNHCVYFFDQLNEKNLINYSYVNNNRVIEHLGNINNVHSKRDNYKNSKSGTPKGIDYINELINSLK